MNVTLPSGHIAPLEPADLARLLACGGTITGLCRAVLAHPELEAERLVAASSSDAVAIAEWALTGLEDDEAAELAAVCEFYGQTPSARVGVTDRTLSFEFDRACLLALRRVRKASKGGGGFNQGDVNGG